MTLRADRLTVPGRLNAVSVDLPPGRITAIVGPNGAGKSTLLAALAGLLPGAVMLGERRLGTMTPRERAMAIGYLPQGNEVAWNMAVATLVRLGRLPHRAGRDADDRAVAAALSAMALDSLAQRPVGTLSGGERARALLARVLAGEPDWVLADEPLASLDLAHARALLRHFRRLADAGKGVVLVLHDLAQAMNHADHVVVLHNGAAVAMGPPAEVLDGGVIAKVWGIDVVWQGEAGMRALIW